MQRRRDDHEQRANALDASLCCWSIAPTNVALGPRPDSATALESLLSLVLCYPFIEGWGNPALCMVARRVVWVRNVWCETCGNPVASRLRRFGVTLETISLADHISYYLTCRQYDMRKFEHTYDMPSSPCSHCGEIHNDPEIHRRDYIYSALSRSGYFRISAEYARARSLRSGRRRPAISRRIRGRGPRHQPCKGMGGCATSR